ncbi:hypothetical protein [Streptobacillus canis]|uniref:hypothetical protein n=1 Tax=Streptobacillus canis TaxID=2678686 RepID=UPI0012E0DA96|nr:hypothetical protein [Streptobacillus canis]
MKNDILTEYEYHKYNVIKNLVENNSNKKRVATLLNISIRQVNRLIKIYKVKGKVGFIHGNRNKISEKRINDNICEKIVDLFKNKYSGSSIKHFTELIALHENIHVSSTFVRKLLLNKYILSPRASKRVRRHM